MQSLTWREALRDLFPRKQLLPERQVWTFYDDIVYSLRSMVRNTTCEIFWADTGGSILKAVEEASEPGCIKLIDGSSGTHIGLSRDKFRILIQQAAEKLL